MKIKLFVIIFVELLITIVPAANAAIPLKVFVNGQPVFGVPTIV
ncbi:hypothetical protein [Bacillus salipaludis]|nr:hypothetical protein [Bacillus salipaludis]